MNKQYGIVLIGCGHIGREHLEDLYFRKEIRVVGTVDRDPERAADFARRYGALDHGTDYHSFLARQDVDIVIIATYADTHLQILRECFAAGKHVICEKPITPDLAQGREFVELVRRSEQKVLISHVLRHNRTYRKVAEMIHAGVIGNLRLMRMVQNHHCKDWERYKRLMADCPPIVDCGVHYFDVMQWFARSPIVEVGGMGTAIDDDLPPGLMNYGIVNAKLANGAVGYYEAGWSRTLASANLKEFIGDKGRIRIVLNGFRDQNTEEGDLIELYLQENNEYRPINLPSKYKNMWGQVRCLIDMIENDAPANPTIDEVFAAFKVALAADEAIRQGRSLRLK